MDEVLCRGLLKCIRLRRSGTLVSFLPGPSPITHGFQDTYLWHANCSLTPGYKYLQKCG